MLNKDLAICIHTADFSETSQILTFFTKANGKIQAIAKGSKRPKSAFDGPVEIFSFGDIVFSESSREKLATVTEFEQKLILKGLVENYFAMNSALFSAELLNKLTDDYDPHPNLFESFLQFLKNASQAKNKAASLACLILFQLSLLAEIGLQPVLKNCVNCKNSFSDSWPEVYFSSSANGLICRDCEESFPDKIRISENAANALARAKLFTDTELKVLNEIERILVYHFTEILGRPPKMAKYILKNAL
jgi:DNA repair protein RecO (recombination protein O)